MTGISEVNDYQENIFFDIVPILFKTFGPIGYSLLLESLILFIFLTIKNKEKNGSSCGTAVGWTRARQLASGKALTRRTIARMASFKRHQQNKDVPYSEGCGGIMWDAWGGSAGVNWAISKLKKIDNKKKK